MRGEHIARTGALTREEFERLYVRRHLPVILTELLVGSCLRAWSLERLAARAPHTTASVYRRVLTDPRDASPRTVETTTAGDYAARVAARPADHAGTSIGCVIDDCPELAAQIPSNPLADPARHFVQELYSGVDYSTSGHAHPSLHALLCHVEGEKDVVLYSPHDGPLVYAKPLLDEEYAVSRADFMSPDPARFPRLSRARRTVVRLSPGDVLFIPVGFWHAVAGIGLSTSISYFWKARLREKASLRAAARHDLGWAIARAVGLVSPVIRKSPAWVRSRVARAYPTLIHP
jgi:hypothetical protein